MVYPTASEYITSINNISGKLRSIKNMTVVYNDNNDPVFTCSRDFIDFNVLYNGKPYKMRCPLRVSSKIKDFVKLYKSDIFNSDLGYIPHYEFFEQELFVMGLNGEHRYCSIALCQIPQGVGLAGKVALLAIEGRCDEIKIIVDKFCKMVKDLLGHKEFTVTFLPLREIVIDQKNDLHILLCDHIIEKSSGNKFKVPAEIYASILELILLYYCPYRLNTNSATNRSSWLDSLLTEAIEISNKCNDEIVRRLADIIRIGQDTSFEELTYILGSISKRDISIVNIDNGEPSNAPSSLERKIEQAIKSEDAGALREGLRAIKVNGKYGYVDSSGVMITDFIYDSASDFDEGRALVSIGSSFGAINTNGHYVMALQYDDLS